MTDWFRRSSQNNDSLRAWLTAIRNLPDNPLLRMWQLQDHRRGRNGSRWLSNHVLLLPTMLLSIAASSISMRQLLALLAEGRSGAVSPLHATTALYSSLHVLLLMLICYFGLLSLARLHGILHASYGFLANEDSLSRTTLDDVLTVAPFSEIEITLAHAWRSIQLGLPPLAGLAIVLGLHRVLWAWASLDLVRPSAMWIAGNLLLLPLLSIIGSALVLAALSSLVLGAGKLEQHNVSSAFGLLLLPLIQPALSWLCYMAIVRYESPLGSVQLLRAMFLGLLPLIIILLFIQLARRNEGVRRVLVSGFSLLALLGFLLVLSICQLLAGRQGMGWEIWNTGPMVFAAAALQSFNVLPAVWDACGRSSVQFYQAGAGGTGLPAGMQVLGRMLLPLPVLLGQLLVLGFSLSFARLMVSRHMLARETPLGAARERGSRGSSSRLDLPKLDRLLDGTLLYLPAGLVLAVAVLALTGRGYRHASGNAMEDWLYSTAYECQDSVVWSRTGSDKLLDHHSDSSRSSSDLASFYVGHQFNKELHSRIQEKLEGFPDPADRARLEYIALNCEAGSMLEWDGELSDEISRRKTMTLLDLRKLGALGAYSLLELSDKLYWQQFRIAREDHNAPGFIPFNTNADSPDFSGSWMDPVDYALISDLQTEALADEEEGGLALLHEATRMLDSGNTDEGFDLLAATRDMPLPDSEEIELTSLGFIAPAGLDSYTSRLLFRVQSSVMHSYLPAPLTMQSIVSDCLKDGQLDHLALIHETVWREDLNLAWDQSMYFDRQMIDALPNSILADPANQAFARAGQDMRNLRLRHSKHKYPFMHYNEQQLCHKIGRIEETLAFGRASPYTTGKDETRSTYFRGTWLDVELPFDSADREALQRIRELDWNTLSLPARP